MTHQRRHFYWEGSLRQSINVYYLQLIVIRFLTKLIKVSTAGDKKSR